MHRERRILDDVPLAPIIGSGLENTVAHNEQFRTTVIQWYEYESRRAGRPSSRVPRVVDPTQWAAINAPSNH